MSLLKLRSIYDVEINGHFDRVKLVEVNSVTVPHSKGRIMEYVFRNKRGRQIKISDRNKIKEAKIEEGQ